MKLTRTILAALGVISALTVVPAATANPIDFDESLWSRKQDE
jgi:hypothetical protein